MTHHTYSNATKTNFCLKRILAIETIEEFRNFCCRIRFTIWTWFRNSRTQPVLHRTVRTAMTLPIQRYGESNLTRAIDFIGQSLKNNLQEKTLKSLSLRIPGAVPSRLCLGYMWFDPGPKIFIDFIHVEFINWNRELHKLKSYQNLIFENSINSRVQKKPSTNADKTVLIWRFQKILD